MTAQCIDWSDVEGAATELAGNHQQFECFAWFDRPDDGDNWAVVYTHHRDSGLLDQSNADAIAKALEPFTEEDDPDVVSEHDSHWAVGWIDGFAIRVFDTLGNITLAFRAYAELMDRLDGYPVLDEQDYSRREYEAAIEWIQQEGRRLVADGAPNDWPEQVFSWLWDNDQRELDNRDDQGACPSREAVAGTLAELGYLDEEE